jgi:hypothetical protein
MELTLSQRSATTAGVLLVSIVAIEWGGVFLLRIVGGKVEMTPFQHAFARAGHAHAGVLVTLSLVCQLFVGATDLTGFGEAVARAGVPLAAILMPAGFFGSSFGPGRTEPNGLIVLVWLGAAALAAGVLTLGVGLLTA